MHRLLQSHTRRRCFSSSYNAPTWERAARRVKNVDAEKDSLYMDAIRDTHDPSMHLKTIEDELKGTIGKALGKQGQKIHYHVTRMQEAYAQYQEKPSPQVAAAFNACRKQAIQARWELLVHRQAAGFIVNNHKYVMEHYPIADALPEDGEVDVRDEPKETKSPKSFGDQLDWWQKIGRWR